MFLTEIYNTLTNFEIHRGCHLSTPDSVFRCVIFDQYNVNNKRLYANSKAQTLSSLKYFYELVFVCNSEN